MHSHINSYRIMVIAQISKTMHALHYFEIMAVFRCAASAIQCFDKQARVLLDYVVMWKYFANDISIVFSLIVILFNYFTHLKTF